MTHHLSDAERLFLDQAVSRIKQNEEVSETEAIRLLTERLRRFARIAQTTD
jgi:hypothetical protein